MRLISVIFLTYISLLMVSPALCEMYSVLEKVDLCCGKETCSKDQPSEKKQSQNPDSNESCLTCCSIQSCFCYFEVVSQEDSKNVIFLINNKITTKNEQIFSDYLADFWHPPQII